MKAKWFARRAVDAIVEDLSDRRGLRQEWEGIDREIRTEIRKVWIDIVEAKIREALATERTGKDQGEQ